MIIEEKNTTKQDIERQKKIAEMLQDVRLPKNYVFANDYFEIRVKCFLGTNPIAEIYLDEDVLEIKFDVEEELNKLRHCFVNSKTKFKLSVGEYYY